jgi:hypothetical protein
MILDSFSPNMSKLVAYSQPLPVLREASSFMLFLQPHKNWIISMAREMFTENFIEIYFIQS